MERLRVYIGWTVPVGLLLRKLTYAEAQAATPFIVAVALWAAYLLVDFVGHYSFGADYNQLGQQVSGKAFDPLVMDRRARRARPPRPPAVPARRARPPAPPLAAAHAAAGVRTAWHAAHSVTCDRDAPGTSARRRSEARARRRRSPQP